MQKQYGWESRKDTPLILSSASTVAATELYLSLRPHTSGDYFSTGQSQQWELMRSGKTALAIMWSDTLFSLVHSPGAPTFGFAPIPGSKSQIGGGIFYVSKRSKHAALAAKFIAYYLREDIQARLVAKGLCSPLRSAYDTDAARQVPYSQSLLQSLERGVYMSEAGPDADLVQEVVTNGVQRIARGEVAVKPGLMEAEKELAEKRAKILADIH